MLANKNYVEGIKADLESKLSGIPKFDTKVVSSLPEGDAISTSTIYLLTQNPTQENNQYVEYLYSDGKWEQLGAQTINLQNYYTKIEVDGSISILSKKIDDCNNNLITLSEYESLFTAKEI